MDFNKDEFMKKIRGIKKVRMKVDQPIVDQPIVDQPIVDEPIVDQPIVDQPIVDEPIVDQPIVDQPIVDEPIVDEPIVDQPIVDQPIVDQPIVEKKKGKKRDKKIKLKSTLTFDIAEDEDIDKVIPLTKLKFGEIIKPKLNLSKEEVIVVSDYYRNNREIFVNFINSVFEAHKDALLAEEQNEEKTLSCDKNDSGFSLLTHQKIVRDYINLNTPYRGLLLYHGLGSGKTCSSIAIAEGIKNKNKIIVMTPASLRPNYIEELKKCGDYLYKKNQYWEFIEINTSIDNNNIEYINSLTKVIGIRPSFVKKNGGIWFVDVKKTKNYETLTNVEKESLDAQLNEMIGRKYQFINYNGLRQSHLDAMTKNGEKNPFSNSVVIIDEAHNFVSRIVNKLDRKNSIGLELYEYLMSAENCRIVFLSGTPIINYPNEVAVMFNMLRGYIKTIKIPLQVQTSRKMNEATLTGILEKLKLLDYIEYKPSQKTLLITRNPFGFVSRFDDSLYKGVFFNKEGKISDEELIKLITAILEENDIKVLSNNISIQKYKALPDNIDAFREMFIVTKNDEPAFINETLFKRRILGLSSYFRSAQEQLMPAYDEEKDYIVEKVPMSMYQFSIYEGARMDERKREELIRRKKKQKKGGDIFKDFSSTYRIFSRAFCNFVFPENVKRPMPNEDKDIEDTLLSNVDEDMLDNASVEEKLENVDGIYTLEDADKMQEEINELSDGNYEKRINTSLSTLNKNAEKVFSTEGLAVYSPKFLKLLQNIEDPAHRGLHLLYSQFRTLEGIGIFKLVLEANGYVQFKVRKERGKWVIDIKEEDMGKPTFALYTGTEFVEEKEIIRNIFNGNWGSIPNELVSVIKEISSNNNYGEIIRVFMITASGAEGISLKNVKHVHLLEPYWHPVRLEQVIGRARRICSHNSLPEKDRTVKVFLYLMTFTEEILKDASIELKIKDNNLTSDEYLYKVSNAKLKINSLLLNAIKETSIDCGVHNRSSNKEELTCFSFSSNDPNKFSFVPSISQEQSDIVSNINVKRVTWKAKTWTAPNGKKYAVNPEDNRVYDLDSYMVSIKNPEANPILKGQIIKKDGKFAFKQL